MLGLVIDTFLDSQRSWDTYCSQRKVSSKMRSKMRSKVELIPNFLLDMSIDDVGL